MARPFGGNVRVFSTPQAQAQQMQLFAGARVNQGMIVDIDPADIPDEALVNAKNARVRVDKSGRRTGTALWTPAAPDANPVLLVFVMREADGTLTTLRFTPSSLYKRSSVAWSLLTPGTALTGAATDRFQAVAVLDKLLFSNGVDRIYLVNLGALTYDVIAAAPKAKYITGFFNRVIAANYNVDGLTAANGAMIGWCKDGDVTVWDNAVDPSAGKTPLLESPSDLGDPITGVFGGTNVMVILRELSIWLATKNPSASNPFNFQAAVPGIGCNAPHSAEVIPGGLCWYDSRTQAVWAYSVGGTPERISFGKIEKEINRGVIDPALLFSSYSAKNLEFQLCSPIANSQLVRTWIHNFATKAWSYDEIPNTTALDDVSFGPPVITIDDLQGEIDQLIGTIDSLVATGEITTSRLIGRSDGTILLETEGADDDAGTSYTTTFESKDFANPVLDNYFARLRFEYECTKPGTLTLSYSKDRGETWKAAKSVEMITGINGLMIFNKTIRAQQLRWRLESTNGLWNLLAYEIHYYPSGTTRQEK